MRIVLAILAWWVMAGAVLGAVTGTVGASILMHKQGLTGTEMSARLLAVVSHASFQIVEALALGLGLLFLLDVDKRLRSAGGAAETR